jgi:hypothetical protein
MPEEMVTLTSDSPAEAPGGLGNAVADFIQDNAGLEDNSQWATSENEGSYETADDGYDDVQEVDDTDYDALTDELLGVDDGHQMYVQEQEEPGAVPYERFREVNERARQATEYEDRLNRWGRVIENLEAQGYQDADAVDAMLAQQEQQQREYQIQNRYRQMADQQLMDPQLAEAQARAEIMQQRYEQQMAQVNQYMLSQQRDYAVQQYPLAQRAPDLVDNLISAGFSPEQAAQAVHEQVRTITRSLVPEITSRLSRSQRSPQPMGNANTAVPASPGRGVQQQRGSSIGALLGIVRGKNTL